MGSGHWASKLPSPSAGLPSSPTTRRSLPSIPQALMTLVGVFLGYPKLAAAAYLALAVWLAWQYLRWVGGRAWAGRGLAGGGG